MRKLANDLCAPANGQRILVVHGRIIDGNRNVAKHEILLVHFDHAVEIFSPVFTASSALNVIAIS
jgi:hypothetical protein